VQDASDADAQVAEQQDDLPIGDIGWHRLDAAQTLSDLIAQISEHLPASAYRRQSTK
jgi:hypothetical protein